MLSTIRDTESEHVPRCGAETAEGVAERSEKNMGPGKMGEGPGKSACLYGAGGPEQFNDVLRSA